MATGVDIEVNVFQSTFPSLSTLIAIAQFLHHTLGLLHFLNDFLGSIAFYWPLASCDF